MRVVLGVEGRTKKGGGALWDSELVQAAGGAGDLATTARLKNIAGARGLGRGPRSQTAQPAWLSG